MTKTVSLPLGPDLTCYKKEDVIKAPFHHCQPASSPRKENENFAVSVQFSSCGKFTSVTAFPNERLRITRLYPVLLYKEGKLE